MLLSLSKQLGKVVRLVAKFVILQDSFRIRSDRK